MHSLRLRNGHCLRFHDLPGEGVPIVVVHGLGCAASCDYPAVARDAALASRRVVLVDLLGYGFSDKPATFAYGIDAHADTVCELVRHLDAGPVDLVGHSMGGAVAVAAAVKLGKSVRRLVLTEPNLDPGGGTYSRGIAAQAEAQYVSRGQAIDVRDAIAAGDHAWAGSLGVALAQAVHRDAVSLVEGTQPAWRARLLGLAIPRAMIFGERSLPDADHAGMPAHGVEVDVVPHAGHSMATENPAGLAAALARCLA